MICKFSKPFLLLCRRKKGLWVYDRFLQARTLHLQVCVRFLDRTDRQAWNKFTGAELFYNFKSLPKQPTALLTDQSVSQSVCVLDSKTWMTMVNFLQKHSSRLGRDYGLGHWLGLVSLLPWLKVRMASVLRMLRTDIGVGAKLDSEEETLILAAQPRPSYMAAEPANANDRRGTRKQMSPVCRVRSRVMLCRRGR